MNPPSPAAATQPRDYGEARYELTRNTEFNRRLTQIYADRIRREVVERCLACEADGDQGTSLCTPHFCRRSVSSRLPLHLRALPDDTPHPPWTLLTIGLASKARSTLRVNSFPFAVGFLQL
jgi:hypothetical protein